MSTSKQEIRQRLLDSGLGRIASRLTSAVQPALRLRADPAEEMVLPLGRSKIGGRPDAPAEFQWPTWRGVPLSFLGQVDLATAADFPCCDVLPRQGRLLFFYTARQQTWGFDPNDGGSFAAVYSSAPRSELVRHDWPQRLPNDARFRACAVDFAEVLTLPPWQSIFVEQLRLTDEECDRYFDVIEEVEALDGDDMLHQLLGHPSPIQNEMQLECQLVAHGINLGGRDGYTDPRRAELEPGARSWRLLLQLDSEEAAGMMWGDLGRLYFWIREQDLADRCFERAWLILQCS